MMARSLLLSILVSLLLLASSTSRNAYGRSMPEPPPDTADVYPPELYSGRNVVTIKLSQGIREIRTKQTANIKVEGGGTFPCTKTRDLTVFVNTASTAANLDIEIIDCNNRSHRETISLNTQWTLDHVNYGPVEVGANACREFKVSATGIERVYLDSVSVPDSRVTLRLPAEPPSRINPNTIYTYRVCFKADKPGVYQFPVITWMRRKYPSGGLTTYAVSDTGIVRVIPQKKPDTVALVPPDTSRRIADVLPPELPPITDPTTFRTIAVPNAIIPPQGKFYAGVYDLLGLTAGYSVTDHLMIIAGGALPTPDDWGGIHGEGFGASSIGVKAGFNLTSDISLAGGYQFATSQYDKESTPDLDSKITIHAPYLALSYGDDDSRLSVTGGYAFKHHTKPGIEFDQNATILAFGADYRLARHWKIAGELLSMESIGVVPILGTVRYFTDRFAIDLGAAYLGITTGDNAPPNIPLAPVLSGVFVF